MTRGKFEILNNFAKVGVSYQRGHGQLQRARRARRTEMQRAQRKELKNANTKFQGAGVGRTAISFAGRHLNLLGKFRVMSAEPLLHIIAELFR